MQELNRVHQRYVRISDAFRSAWTFHQFVEGLRKIFPEEGPAPYKADFQTLYNRLKEISKNLTEPGAAAADNELDGVEEGQLLLHELMLSADEGISPGLLRQFFQRVKNYDDGILTQLIKFYIFTQGGDGWTIDRLDKADFLITKLCEEYDDVRGVFALRDRGQLRETTRGLWTALEAKEADESEVSSSRSEVEAIAEQLENVDSIDDLNQLGLVQRYRELKHGFGVIFFHPKVLSAIVETNLVAKNRVQELYHKEEQRIIAEYQEIFDLERDVPHGESMRRELEQFRAAVDRFESQLEGSNVRLDELGKLRHKVRELLPRLRGEKEGTGEIELVPLAPPTDTSAGAPRPEYVYVEEPYQRILAVLEDTNPNLDPKKVTLDPVIYELGLEPREVIAYRRLKNDAPCTREHETMMLRAAALRMRIKDEIDEIRGQLDDSSTSRDGPLYAQARETARMGDLFQRRFEHLIERALIDGDIAEAQALTVLKMRMMRIYTGLWLMVYKV